MSNPAFPGDAGRGALGHHDHLWRRLDGNLEGDGVREFGCDHCGRIWFN